MAFRTVDDVWNLALSAIGEEEAISSPTEQTTNAKRCRARSDSVRQSLLSRHKFSCARKRKSLASTPTTSIAGYDYCYPLPSDCLLVLQMIGLSGEDVEYEMFANDTNTGIVLACNDSVIYVDYIADIDNIKLLPDSFCRYWAYMLAIELSGLYSLDSNDINSVIKFAADAKASALLDNARQAGVLKKDSSYITDRG